MKRVFASLAAHLVITLLVPAAAADVLNGKFDGGLDGWTLLDKIPGTNFSAPERITVEPTVTGGNPAGCLLFSGDCHLRIKMHGGVSQTFEIGEAGSGTSYWISFDYRINHVICSANFGTATLYVFLDSVEQVRVAASSSDSGWRHVEFLTTAGTHTLAFWGNGQYGWNIRLDSVLTTVNTEVSTTSVTWSRIKALPPALAE